MRKNEEDKCTSEEPINITERKAQRRLGLKTRLVLGFSVIWLAPTLACGSFAPRPTPTPSPVAVPTLMAVPGAETPVPAAAGLIIVDDTPVASTGGEITGSIQTTTTGAITTGTTIATAAAPPAAAGTVLAAGQPARVTAPNGVNMRETASTAGTLIIQLGTGQLVTVLEGPTQADQFTWWRIDDGTGRTGWVVDGDGETVWLSPQIGVAQPVNRAPRVGERVVISSQVSVRALPGASATLLTYANNGAQFTVLAGPQTADGYTWFQIRSDDGTIEGWAADGDGTTRWISPLE